MPSYRRLLVAALCVVLWACGDGAGPADFDPAPLEEQLIALSDDLLFRPGVFGVALFEIGSAMNTMDIDTLAGKTMEFVESPGKFRITTRTGAPPDGVRFLLYQPGGNGAFAQPLVETGYLDMWNQTTSVRRQVHVVAVVNGVTVADYVAYATGEDERDAAWGVTGLADLSGSRADIVAEGVRQIVHGANRKESTAEITLYDSSLHYTGSLEYVWGGSGPWSYSSSTVVDGAGGLVELDGLEVSGEFSGKVEVNGTDFATFTGPDRDHPVYIGVGDADVTAADRRLFERMVISRSLPGEPVHLLEVAGTLLSPVFYWP